MDPSLARPAEPSVRRLRSLRRSLRIYRLYVWSRVQGARYRHLFRDVERFCMFVGYPRSGHSLVGALIDAHPNALISHEVHMLRYVQYKFSKHQLFYLVLENSRDFAAAGRPSAGYSYAVPNQWQGRFAKLAVLGDKKGGASVDALRRHPRLLRRLRRTIGMPIKFVHVLRNPYDNIATICRRQGLAGLRESVDFYFALVRTMVEIKSVIPAEDLFELRHEDLLEHPAESLAALCRFLGLHATDDYLRDCASLLFKAPRKTRWDVEWTPELIEAVRAGIGEAEFLADYRYDD